MKQMTPCPYCDAMNAEGAHWCGLCHRRFAAADAEVMHPGSSATDEDQPPELFGGRLIFLAIGLRLSLVAIAMFCSWVFAYIFVQFFSHPCKTVGGITSCVVGAPTWGGPFMLLTVAGSTYIAWRITRWITARRDDPEGTPVSVPVAVISRALWVGTAFLGLGVAIPVFIASLVAGRCPGDECHGLALVAVGYAFVMGSGGLLLSAGMYARRGRSGPRELRWVTWIWGLIGVLLLIWTAVASLPSLPIRPELTILWFILSGFPGATGVIAFWCVRTISRAAKQVPVVTFKG